jgi:putative ABC transport system permease protein
MVGLWIASMGILAAYEAQARVEYVYPQLLQHLIVAFVGGGGMILILTNMLGILGNVQPGWNPRTWIPVAGMMLGNSLSATSLAIRTITHQLVESQTDIELRLAMGASWQEAIRSILLQTYSTALTPVIHALSVAGVVHIPGMMTGQILAGQSVFQAAAYQLVIFFLFTATALSTVRIITQLAIHKLVEPSKDRLQLQKLKQRQQQQQQLRNNTPLNRIQQIALQVAGIWKAIADRKASTSIANETPLDIIKNGIVTEQLKPLQYVNMERSSDHPVSEKPVIFKVTNMTVARTNMEVSFEAREGDRIAIQGKSGIGKSQLLRTLAGFEELDRHNCVLLLDSTCTTTTNHPTSMAEWRSHVTMIPQQIPNLEGTPRQFFAYVHATKSQMTKRMKADPNPVTVQSPMEFLSQWGLSDEILDQNWSTLSGGEKQRVIISIALALQPSVLLLDESLNALDESTQVKVENTLKQTRIPIIMVSHSQLQVERFCNQRIILLEPEKSGPILSIYPQ